MLRTVVFLILVCFGGFSCASDDYGQQDDIPPTPLLTLSVKGQPLDNDTVRKEIYSHAIKCMKEKGVSDRDIGTDRMHGVYVALKDLELRRFESELDAIHTAREQIDELVTAGYLAFLPKRDRVVLKRTS